RHRVGDRVQVALRHVDPFGETTRPLYPDDRAIAAEIPAPGEAQVAPAARHRRVDDHARTGVGARAAELVPHDEWRHSEGTPRPDPFQLGAADPTRLDVDQDFALGGGRLVDLEDLQLEGRR